MDVSASPVWSTFFMYSAQSAHSAEIPPKLDVYMTYAKLLEICNDLGMMSPKG
jgi:hypothetical protein